MINYLNIIIIIYTDPDPIRIWNGDNSIIINSNTYMGAGKLISVGEMEVAAGSPQKRTNIAISGIEQSFRQQFLQDVGPLRVDIGFIGLKHTDLDQDVPLSNIPNFIIQGRISTPSFKDGILSVEIESKRGQAPDGEFVKISHEDHLKRYPGDKCFEYMAKLSRGEIQTKWPT